MTSQVRIVIDGLSLTGYGEYTFRQVIRALERLNIVGKIDRDVRRKPYVKQLA